MTLKEASERFRIDIEKLKLYEDSGLLKCSQYVNGVPNYTEKELRKAGMINSLHKAGLEMPLIKQYLLLANDKAGQIRLLRKQRCLLLEEIRGKQQSLDELDYMIDEIRKEAV